MPWIVSLAAHLLVLLTVGFLLAAPLREPLAPQVDITLVGAPGTGHGALRAGGSSTTGTFVPRPPRGEIIPSEPAVRPAPVSAAAPASRPVVPAGPVPTPSASDVLADTAAVAASTSDAGSGSADAAGSPTGTQFDWEGLPRKLIRKRTPEFPTVLSATGQEVELDVRLSVAPSGVVTRVEIARSSGYIEIDAIVEAAVRDYLYSRVDGRAETVGTVHFRFRLEKKD
jgi:TonB family protein